MSQPAPLAIVVPVSTSATQVHIIVPIVVTDSVSIVSTLTIIVSTISMPSLEKGKHVIVDDFYLSLFIFEIDSASYPVLSHS